MGRLTGAESLGGAFEDGAEVSTGPWWRVDTLTAVVTRLALRETVLDGVSVPTCAGRMVVTPDTEIKLDVDTNLEVEMDETEDVDV